MSYRMQDKMSDRMSEYLSGLMSEYMPGKASEYVTGYRWNESFHNYHPSPVSPAARFIMEVPVDRGVHPL